jgi:hypothetical protein
MRFILLISLLLVHIASFAGDFFPADYKSFPFKEGDLLVSQRSGGLYAVNKILKVERFEFKKGSVISIQGKRFTATEDDYLLIVSSAFGESEFKSMNEAKAAALSGTWKVAVGHAPNRPPGAAAGQTAVGHAPVKEAELVGYRQWKSAFLKGEAGVF